MARTLEEQTQSLANWLPTGRAWTAKNIDGTFTRAILRGMAQELLRNDALVAEFREEIHPDNTTLFLDEWESALGIPCECFPGTGTDDERRNDILVKLASLGIQTADDFVALAAIYGFVVTVESGSEYGVFPLEFPWIFFDSEKEARFTIIVRYQLGAAYKFPYTFPIPFGTRELGILECLFQKLKPANCNLIFEMMS